MVRLGAGRRPWTTNRSMLLFAFAFAVMADPVSSVAYAIEAALRALRGNLGLLIPTMALVLAIIVLVIVNYHQIVGRYPQGGGAAAAAGEAFGEARSVTREVGGDRMTTSRPCVGAFGAEVPRRPGIASRSVWSRTRDDAVIAPGDRF